VTRYELLERIGAGRMAEIFRGRAVAAGGFEKPVAIKRILPHLSSDPRFVELLIAEAKILSVLRHRNIVQIFDVGLGDDGTYFLVMEHVDGVDLGVLQRALERRRARLPLDLALHVGAEICDALDHAQLSPTPDGRPLALVHRDVSPGNVLVSRAGEVKLTDFGLARRPEDRRTAGGLRGRFGYVSPEQIAGLPVDGRSDVFSLGVVVWELAVGRRLFSGMADFEALRAITDLPIPPPSTQDRGLPAELDAILAEALARDVDRRLPSAGELGKRLRGLRYSLESSSGDPAAALARAVTGVEREPVTLVADGGGEGARAFEGAEGSVVRIRTAEVFAQRDEDGTGLLEARRLLEAFEDAETRMSSLPAAFDDISTGSGHPLRGVDDRTELTTPPMHLGRDTSEVPITDEVAGGGRGEVRDTGETPTVEPTTAPTRGGSAIDTLRGGGVVAARRAARGAARVPGGDAAAGMGADLARAGVARDTARGDALPETLRGGQAAPLSASAARAAPSSASSSTSMPVREPERGPEKPRSSTPAREPERGPEKPRSSTPAHEPERAAGKARAAKPVRDERRAGSDWSERSRGLEDDFTERTPPPPAPPGAESDPSMGVPLLGSLTGLPSLASLSAGPVNAGPALPGLPPAGSAGSPEPGSAASSSSAPAAPAALAADVAPPYPVRAPIGSEPYVPPVRDRPPVDPAGGYPRSSSVPWGWTPAPAGPLAVLRRWWPVGLGAIAIAILSFVATQALIEPDVAPVGGAPAPPADAALGASEDAAGTALGAGEDAAGTAAPSVTVDAGSSPVDAAPTGAAAAADAPP
jgi:serine/threonine-protein kinase